MQTQEQLVTVAKTTGDMLSLGVVIGTIIELLPAISAGFALMWTLMRIYETWLDIKAKRYKLMDNE